MAKSIVKGSDGGSHANGAVTAICRRCGTTGKSTSTMAPTWADHAPAAQTTVSVAIGPASVRTVVIVPASTSMPVTAQLVRIRTPSARAADAYPATTASGVAWPSRWQKDAANTSSVRTTGHCSAASAPVSIREGTPKEFCSVTLCSKDDTCASVRSRKR